MNIKEIQKNTNQEIKYFEEIESTHLYAKQIEKQGDFILIAEKQTGGIGTKGRKWHTGENKNIALTMIKHPTCKIDRLEGLTTKIAEAIRDVIKELYGYELKIKVPNDLMLNNKKICGILTEIHTRAGNIEYLLISIGFNVNENHFEKEIEQIATSLKKEYKREFDREMIIIQMIHKMEEIIEQM